MDREHFEKYIMERTVALDRASRIILRASRKAYMTGDGARGRKFLDKHLWERMDMAFTPMLLRAAVLSICNATRVLYDAHENCAGEDVKRYNTRIAIADFPSPIYTAVAGATKIVYEHVGESLGTLDYYHIQWFDHMFNLYNTHEDDEMWEQALNVALIEGGRAWSAVQEAHKQKNLPVLEDSDKWSDSDEGGKGVEDV